jgi:hypothetical protein
MNMATKLVRTPGIVWEELGNEALLINVSENSVWSLNESATQIWKYCERCSVEHLVREIARAANRQLHQVEQHVREFVEAMCKNGWLQITAIGAPSGWMAGHVAFQANWTVPAFRIKSLGSGPRRRPSPRGNSGPG